MDYIVMAYIVMAYGCGLREDVNAAAAHDGDVRDPFDQPTGNAGETT